MKRLIPIGSLMCLFLLISSVYLCFAEDLNKKIVNVEISMPDQTKILGKLADGTSTEIIGISDLPKESLYPKGFYLDNKGFKDAKLSPDKSEVAFSVICSGSEWSGIYNLSTKGIKSLNFYYDSSSGMLFWSPTGKYIAEEVDGANEYMILVTDINSNKRELTLKPSDLEKQGVNKINRKTLRRFKEGKNTNITEDYKIEFTKWDDEKTVLFKIVKVKEVRELKKPKKMLEKTDLGNWSIGLNKKDIKSIDK